MAPGAEREFHEVQRFREWRLWILLVAVAAAPAVLLGWALVQQLVLDRPFGDEPMSDRALAVFGPAMILASLASAWVVWSLKLTTRVQGRELRLRIHPFRERTIRFDEIASAKARTYKPIAEYGGWGLKRGRSGLAYNVRGDRGVQLVLRDGRKILVGSQRAEELARSLEPLP